MIKSAKTKTYLRTLSRETIKFGRTGPDVFSKMQLSLGTSLCRRSKKFSSPGAWTRQPSPVMSTTESASTCKPSSGLKWLKI
jgi:hypothetical protein